MNSYKRKSPFNRALLNAPGQSQDRRTLSTLLNEAVPWLSSCILLVALTALDWWRWAFNLPPAPVTMTVFTTVFIGWVIWRKRGLISQMKRDHLGAMGEGRSNEVAFDGQRILVNGLAPNRDPIRQIRANAGHVRTVLRNRFHIDVSVRPVVLFPEWFVHEHRKSDVWVLNSDRFLGWAKHEPQSLDAATVATIAQSLTSYARERSNATLDV